MEAIPHPIPRTVEEVFSDFKGRRAGLIKALTAEKENLSLFGLPNETWEVNLPVEEVPPELPEPVLGINFARDGMQEKDWLSLVAVHSDSWLLAVAFYFGARFGFGKNERKKLFQMINDLPTIFEVVTGNAKQPKDPYLLNPFSGSRILRNFSGRCGSSWRWLQPIPHPIPRTVEEVFSDFKGRRAGFEYKALTADVEKFYQQCDPEKENLCLYGLPNETWEVNLPVEEVPPELPEPALGINFARDGMQEKDWLSLVAVHSDSWLLAVAFYFGARFGFGKNERKKLFQMINDLPTIFEVVTGNAKQPKDLSANHNSSKSKSSGKSRPAESQTKAVKMSPPPKDDDDSGDEEEEDDEQGATCGACGDNYGTDEFWICCDICEKWFHGKCVKITPAKAEHIKQYKCPSCSSKRARV
ncbi:hypothetical protein CUMW_270230 [Citrus unshiu]|uniref:PHD finger protein ALFIN-LIKE n=1 Tax=Citrus unshiu TaxID=55188 RepID=A0A2H5QY35_CITUN|nr:hypothetical protein CUMW_270230 [Citrus unshiu]